MKILNARVNRLRNRQKGFTLVELMETSGRNPHPYIDSVPDDPWGNPKAAFSGSTEILREEWGLTWNVALESGGVLVSKKSQSRSRFKPRRPNGDTSHPECRYEPYSWATQLVARKSTHASRNR